jgi:hypothetical protein
MKCPSHVTRGSIQLATVAVGVVCILQIVAHPSGLRCSADAILRVGIASSPHQLRLMWQPRVFKRFRLCSRFQPVAEAVRAAYGLNTPVNNRLGGEV